VHNLRRIDWEQPAGGFDWNLRFDEAASALLQEMPGDILRLVEHEDFDLAVPTPDHFIPLLYIAALAAATSETADVLVDGPAYGSLSMASYTVGIECPEPDGEPAAPLPEAGAAPPDHANI
jgi:4,5-DOPA dioxygenase extradiol